MEYNVEEQKKETNMAETAEGTGVDTADGTTNETTEETKNENVDGETADHMEHTTGDKMDDFNDLEVPEAPTTACKDALTLSAAGGYKSRNHGMPALPEVALYSGADAAKRLVALKERINALQKMRTEHRVKQTAAAGAAVGAAGAAAVSLGAGAVAAVASGGVGLHQRFRVGQTKSAIVQCLVQIGAIRARFGGLEAVAKAEEEVRIAKSVFGMDIKRDVLQGDL